MSHRLFTFILCGLFVCTQGFSAEETFLLTNGVTNEIVLEIGPHINTQISPCSTFKMTLAVMGYDAGTLIDEETPTWDFQEGYDDFLETWKVPLTPQSWMTTSCLWYSKVLSLHLGLEKMQSYLNSMNYGNKDLSGGLAQPGPKGVAWINSSLKISPREQVEFIQKMVLGKLPIAPSAIQMTKTILFKEESSDGWKLFGKTGWSGSDITKDGHTLQHGWFVGWIEKGDQFFPFAYLIREQKIDLNQRIPRVKQLLIKSNVLSGTWHD